MTEKPQENSAFEQDLDLNTLKKDLLTPKLSPEQLEQALQTYVDTMQTLTPTQFRKSLHQLYAPKIYFKDPFNETRGLAALEKVFAQRFKAYPNAELRFHTHAGQGDTGYVEWRLLYMKQNKPMQLNGISKLLFDENGKVKVQMDYWDSGEHYFRKLPILGGLLNWLADKHRAN